MFICLKKTQKHEHLLCKTKHRPICKIQNNKASRRQCEEKLDDFVSGNKLLDETPKT